MSAFHKWRSPKPSSNCPKSHQPVSDGSIASDESFQAAVALFYVEDYSYPEIAEILGVPLGTVKSRISRGVAQLQQLLVHPEKEAARE